MTYKPGDKVLIEATLLSMGDNAICQIFNKRDFPAEILVKGSHVHPMPEYQNGETVMVRPDIGGIWREANYIGADPTGVNQHFVIGTEPCDKIVWPVSLHATNIRRPQKKYTVELTEDEIALAKKTAERFSKSDVTSDAINICMAIAEQCHD